jgi:hypothetical protein
MISGDELGRAGIWNKVIIMQTRKSLWALGAIGVLALAAGTTAQAQNAIRPAGGGRFYVELKDASLADALEMVFKAAGNPSHIIDESARTVQIGASTFPNATWDSIVLQLANQNGFLVRTNAAGTKLIEPRVPQATPGGTAPGGMPGSVPNPFGGPPRPTTPRPVPAIPFGAALEGDGNATIMANAQANRRRTTGGAAGGAAGARGQRRQLNPEGEYRLIVIKHIYAGGITRIFADADEPYATELMVYPASAANSGGGGGGGGIGGGGIGGGGIGGNNNRSGGIGGGGFGSNRSGSGNSGGGSFFSDRNLKENFDVVDNRSILERVKDLPLATWNYKDQDPAVRHIGPMAQDFAAAFGVGDDNRRINIVDANGVTLASIQALYQMAQQQATQLKTLQQQLEELKAENQKLRGADAAQ